jgi:hypothetical protein
MKRAPIVLVAFLVGCGGSDAATPPATDDAQIIDTSSSTETSPGEDVATDAATDTAPVACGALATWADTATTSRDVHVRAGASGGDGSEARPFGTIAAAVPTIAPGVRVVIHAGTYAPGAYVSNAKGTASQPIVITGAPGEAVPTIAGGAEAIHFTDATYLVVQDLEVTGQTANGLNFDDGGTIDTPSHHVVIRRVNVHDVASGNHDGIKMSGVDDAHVLDSTFNAIGGQMVDMVGCHRVTVARNTFRNGETVGVQMKGGSSDDVVTRNVFINAGPRGVNMGGSTGLEFFRPIDAKFEAARILASDNVFVGGDTPLAYVGCDECSAIHNTIVRPNRWAARILQETVDATRFVPSRRGKFLNNVVVVATGISGETVNVGANTEPMSFTFANNLWFHTSNPSFRPALPVMEAAPVYGDPLLANVTDPTKPDAHLGAGSPAIGKGSDQRALVPGDHDGKCWAMPPSIGAYER